MHRILALAFLLGVLGGVPAGATFCSTDEVPAATLLLPYFEVDLNDPAGLTTLFSINNAWATAGLAHVTLWTDWAIPTIDFDVYLTGYDVQTFNLRDLFNGRLPVTASDLQDPADQISPQGFLSQDIGIASCTAAFPYPSVISALLQSELRLAHSGGNAAQLFGGCLSENYGDAHVRGYITVDAVRECSFGVPGAPGYFDTIAGRDNRLWGTVTYVDPTNNFAQQESLVHLEACDPADLSQPCPTGAGSDTFYGRYVGFDGSDDREPLPAVFAASYLNGGAFDGGTRLIAWRDTKRGNTGLDGGAACSLHRRPSWYPLRERDVVSFDEQENAQDHCFLGDVILPIPNQPGCFPLATQQIAVGSGGVAVGDELAPVTPFGWLRLDLNPPVVGGQPPAERGQAWVIAVSSASGRFSTAVDTVRLDSACDGTLPAVVIP